MSKQIKEKKDKEKLKIELIEMIPEDSIKIKSKSLLKIKKKFNIRLMMNIKKSQM